MHREPSTPADSSPGAMDRAQERVAEPSIHQGSLACLQAATTDPVPRPRRQVSPAAAGQPAPASPSQEGKRGEAGTPVGDLARWRPGEPVQVGYRGQLPCVATVEEVAPCLGVVWVREARGGYRRLIHLQDTGLRRHSPRHRGRGDR